MIQLLRLSRPLYLILVVLTYVMGASLAAYLGNPYDGASFWLGLVSAVLAQAAMFLLADFFRPAGDPIMPEESFDARRTLRDMMLSTAVAGLAALALSGFVLYNRGHLSSITLLFLFFSLLLVVLYGVPPFRLVSRGFGEVILAVHLAYVIPAIAFLLQASEYHRLLGMVAFPLTLLALACFIALSFPYYARDRRYNRGTMLVRIGWERAVPLHNTLIAAAYAILLAAPLFGISLALIWPAFLTVPFALLEIFSLRGIALGGKPVWPFLTVTAASVFGLTAYFLTLTFWLR